MSIQRLAYTVAQAAAAVGLSRYVLYHAITRKELSAFQPHEGARFLILTEDLKAWVTRLPANATMKPRHRGHSRLDGIQLPDDAA